MKLVTLPVVAVLALALLAVSSPNEERGATRCVDVSGASVWSGLGWNHLVAVTNHCASDVRCSVSTNVDPEVIDVAVAKNETVQVVTAFDSQERVFVPRVSCDDSQAGQRTRAGET